jgi:hypothetical protein
MSSRVVRAIEKAAPKPVSASTSSGNDVTPHMRRTSSHTSLRLVMPRSGRPKEAFATPAPGQVDRPEPGALGKQRAVGVDRARDLQRALDFGGVAQAPARDASAIRL